MARPRTINADIIASFHCSPVLRAAISKSAALASGGNTSKFIRLGVEDSCRKILGDEVWEQFRAAERKEIRIEAMEGFLRGRDVYRLRSIIDPNQLKSTDPIMVLNAIDSYISEFDLECRQPLAEAAICVALQETLDCLRKIRSVLSKKEISGAQRRLLRRLNAALPANLRADFDAVVLDRLVGRSP